MLSANERNATLQSAILAAVDAGTKNLRCACPGIVQEWNATTQTVSVKLAIKEVLRIDGVQNEVEIPMLVDVPVVLPRAGGFSLLITPQAGDECLVIFSDLCIDAWYQSGGIQSQAEFRRHDLSDGFAVLGCWSQVRKPTYPASGLRLQNDAGTAYISIDNNGVHFLGADDIDIKPNGVAIGMTSTATDSDRKFEVAANHKAVFNGDVEFSGESGEITFAGGLNVNGAAVFGAQATFQDAVQMQNNVEIWHSWKVYEASELTGVTMTDATNDPVKVTRVGDMVYMQGVVHFNSELGSGRTLEGILTLPDGCVPSDRVILPCITRSTMCLLHINTDGTVDIENFHSTGISTGYDVILTCSFVGGGNAT